MSYEAWGDDDDGSDRVVERLLNDGWWSADDAEEVKELVRALASEHIYENGRKEDGVSVRFLMRLTLLRARVGLDVPTLMVEEAKAALTKVGA
jgi:hypothetical protein